MFEFPESWVVGPLVSKWIDGAVDWLVINGDAVFSGIKDGLLRGLLLPMDRFLLWLPWWALVIVTVAVAWKVAGKRIAVISGVSLIVLGSLGLWDSAMSTLAIVLASTVVALGLGIPIGIAAAKSPHFDGVLRPVLDGMQTMPSFVYLIPAIMLLGIGKVPAVMATVIYAIPPIIRLTSLGIRQVDREVVEAARAFGSTSFQVLSKVEFPMALPTIMAGVNQTIMMALAMVVLASMIGAKGLGVEVLNGLARLEVGRGFLGGVGIVIMAIILDRISQGLAKPHRARST